MVNIHDVDKSMLPEGDRLKAMFDRQRELMEKYHHIEKESGLLQTEDVPVDINDKFGQARLKDFAWRITEELGEAMEAKAEPEVPGHAEEELADALHFLIEFTILAGKDDNLMEEFESGREEDGDKLDEIYNEALKHYAKKEGSKLTENRVALTIRYLSQACNCLKNKPWKQSHMLTDIPRFYDNLKMTWITFMGVCLSMGMNSSELHELYFGKSDVNKFRQRSNY